MEELKVDTIIISKQIEETENYKRFKEIIKKKKIRVIVVNPKDKIQIEKNIYLDILWPNNDNLINKNAINNNSIVARLHYKNFSILFTGDIEEESERAILNKNINLKADILKVAHHGSKTSTSQEFLEKVSPKIALIGVGKNNKFGHPNNEVIDKLNEKKVKIYRTDENGEIFIEINFKEKIKIYTKIK